MFKREGKEGGYIPHTLGPRVCNPRAWALILDPQKRDNTCDCMLQYGFSQANIYDCFPFHAWPHNIWHFSIVHCMLYSRMPFNPHRKYLRSKTPEFYKTKFWSIHYKSLFSGLLLLRLTNQVGVNQLQSSVISTQYLQRMWKIEEQRYSNTNNVW